MSAWDACFHEAGHAVVATALGQRFDYITMRARHKGHAAHVMIREWREGQWESSGAICAAGILAQDLHLENCGYMDKSSAEETRRFRQRRLTRDFGRIDLRILKDLTWHAYERSVIDGQGSSATLIQPHWSPEDLAVVAWRRAAVTLATHWDAVDEVAQELYYSTKKLTYSDVRSIFERAWTDDEAESDFSEEYLKPWFLDHSRLKWMPSDKWFADVEHYAEMRRRHEVAARCADCGCPATR